MSNKISFESEHKAFCYLFAGLITLTCFPVLAWHYIGNLSGLAVLAIGGLLATDAVLWFSAHWAVKAKSGAMRAVALLTKFFIACVAVFIAGTVIVIMRGDRQTESLFRQQTEARKSEIQARATAAAQLAQVTGGRLAAREAMRMNEGESVAAVADHNREQLESFLPAWYWSIGIYTLPPICALLGYMSLTIAATILRRREMEHETTETQAQAFPQGEQTENKPRIVWRGGQQVTSEKALLGN